MSKIYYTIAGEVMYWTPAQLSGFKQKAQNPQYIFDESSASFKSEEFVNFIGEEVASICNSRQEYSYLDNTSGAHRHHYFPL